MDDEEAITRDYLEEQARQQGHEEVPRFYRLIGHWFHFVICALIIAAMGFATFGVIVIFRALVGLNW